jgi:hypothetical protein
MSGFDDIIKKREEENNNKEIVPVKEDKQLEPIKKELPVAVFPSEAHNPEVMRYYMSNVRKCNTIPEKVEIEVTFKEPKSTLRQYEYVDQKMGRIDADKRPMIMAIIKYKPEVGKLVCDQPWFLSMPTGIALSLENYLNNNGNNHNLVDRSFRVHNKNKHTIIWKEITKEEQPEETNKENTK